MNTLLLLSLGSLIPFLISFYSIRLYIPCPQMAAVVSNSLVGVVRGKDGRSRIRARVRGAQQ